MCFPVQLVCIIIAINVNVSRRMQKIWWKRKYNEISHHLTGGDVWEPYSAAGQKGPGDGSNKRPGRSPQSRQMLTSPTADPGVCSIDVDSCLPPEEQVGTAILRAAIRSIMPSWAVRACQSGQCQPRKPGTAVQHRLAVGPTLKTLKTLARRRACARPSTRFRWTPTCLQGSPCLPWGTWQASAPLPPHWEYGTCCGGLCTLWFSKVFDSIFYIVKITRCHIFRTDLSVKV